LVHEYSLARIIFFTPVQLEYSVANFCQRNFRWNQTGIIALRFARASGLPEKIHGLILVVKKNLLNEKLTFETLCLAPKMRLYNKHIIMKGKFRWSYRTNLRGCSLTLTPIEFVGDASKEFELVWKFKTETAFMNMVIFNNKLFEHFLGREAFMSDNGLFGFAVGKAFKAFAEEHPELREN